MIRFFSLREITRPLRWSSGEASRVTKSTILGLTLGVFLAGYAVFAFTPPTVAPTGGNVDAPLNVGSVSQVKTGGLWVGSLGTDGGATFGGDVGIGTTSPTAKLDVNGEVRIGNFVTKPACGAGNVGSFVFDTTNNKPYVCAIGSVWKPLDSDFDEDGLMETLDPDDTIFNPVCAADNGGECYLSQALKSSLDGDLAAGNIKSGVNVFGVTGTYAGEILVLTKLVTLDRTASFGIEFATKTIQSFNVPSSVHSWACSYGISSRNAFFGGPASATTKLVCDGVTVFGPVQSTFQNVTQPEPTMNTGILTAGIGTNCELQITASVGFSGENFRAGGGCYAVGP